MGRYRRRHEEDKALADIADLEDLALHPAGPFLGRSKVVLPAGLQVLDLNQHFIELSNPEGDEPRGLVLPGLLGLLLCGLVVLASLWALRSMATETSGPRLDLTGYLTVSACFALVGLLALAGAVELLGFTRDKAFTALRVRYRFNRSTGKVYVLRPRRWGGPVILDWAQVGAHTSVLSRYFLGTKPAWREASLEMPSCLTPTSEPKSH